MVWDLHSLASVAMSSVDISWKAALKPLKIQQGMHQRSPEKGLQQVNILTRATLTILAKHCVMLPIEKKKQAGRLDICSIFGRALNEGNAQVLPTSLSPTASFLQQIQSNKKISSPMEISSQGTRLCFLFSLLCGDLPIRCHVAFVANKDLASILIDVASKRSSWGLFGWT